MDWRYTGRRRGGLVARGVRRRKVRSTFLAGHFIHCNTPRVPESLMSEAPECTILFASLVLAIGGDETVDKEILDNAIEEQSISVNQAKVLCKIANDDDAKQSLKEYFQDD
eukprot:Hpha_TRINITY_DN16801_c0_g1::TRINITY_DN16801_c0_g1_i2::g.149522::m.149522